MAEEDITMTTKMLSFQDVDADLIREVSSRSHQWVVDLEAVASEVAEAVSEALAEAEVLEAAVHPGVGKCC